MQPQSDFSQSKQKAKGTSSQQQQHQQSLQFQATSTTTTATPTAAAAAHAAGTAGGAGQKQESPRHNSNVKLVKGKKPLCQFKFYLDICDHQLTKKIEEQIKHLGGSLEFFLTSSVTHFVTDKTVLPSSVGNNNNNNNITLSSRPATPQTPITPTTPQTPYSLESYDGKFNAGSATTPGGGNQRTRQSRADAILNRARRQSTTTGYGGNSTPTANVTTVNAGASRAATATKELLTARHDTTQTYVIWQTEYALHYLKKVHQDVKEHLVAARDRKLNGKSGGRTTEPIQLKTAFIKVEAKKPNYRPYYHFFRKPAEWPKIELTRDDGAFRLSPKKTLEELETETAVAPSLIAKKNDEEKNMTRKSRSRSSQRQHGPLPAAVQALRKGETANKSSGGGQQHRNSNVAGADGGCKQINKESSDKQCGVCEICKIEYDTLTIHLKTKDHEYFAKNSQNFIALDTLIHASADVNKFLEEQNSKIDIKSEPEEMDVEEVEENDAEANVMEEVEHRELQQPNQLEGTGDLNEVDPLVEHTKVVSPIDATTKRRSSGANKTPSPTVREKSKRITKGKHSSEKFQNSNSTFAHGKQRRSSSKSPKTPPKQVGSPQKPSSSMLEMQRIETAAVVNAACATTPTTTTRRKNSISSAAISPPIRAMLPPSSLYKVVETQEVCTPTHKVRGEAGDLAVGSPSLIVKFKKVRQTELLRLNGEAESFMFPKRHNSSELPTDVDRQTTSDNMRVRISSTSLDSSSTSVSDHLDAATDEHDLIEAETAEAEQQFYTNNVSEQQSAPQLGCRAMAKAKRRKGQPAAKQSFPSAPIQPAVQLNRSRKSSTAKAAAPPTPSAATAAVAAATIVAATAAITIPEATRKSSRMATAIVTAATTSSRLLRAAVEAAKNNSRVIANAETVTSTTRVAATSTAATTTTTAVTKSSRRKQVLPVMSEKKQPTFAAAELPTATPSTMKRRSRVSVGKVEDRMGDIEPNTDESDNDMDEEVDDDDDDQDDDDDDEDYVESNKKKYYKKRQNRVTTTATAIATTPAAAASSASNRSKVERAKRANVVKRQLRQRAEKALHVDDSDEEETEVMRKKVPVKKAPGPKKKGAAAAGGAASKKPPTKKSPPQRVFDYSKSERLRKLRYAFERVPSVDLWYRVFCRQDVGEEQYFEYFGPTKYRKLPYELGPIPTDYAAPCGTPCKLCQKQNRVGPANPAEEAMAQINIKQEVVECDDAAQDSDYVDSLQLSGTVRSAASDAALETAASTTSAPMYFHRHKKLHLLQRYRQEQQELTRKDKYQDEPSEQTPKALENNVLSLSHNNSGNIVATAILSTALTKCDSKSSTPDRDRDRERAGSTHSTASSCASSCATNNRKHYRNKHLSRAAFLSLELPPRKSPREHASTLALVSCIIKQRQDSQSKPNSETDEPPTTPTPTPLMKQEPLPPATTTMMAATTAPRLSDTKPSLLHLPVAPSLVTASTPKKKSRMGPEEAVIRSPRSTRSAADTPVEELRFATEISENVKRMRRGQNKYDHSPPFGLNCTRSPRPSRPLLSAAKHRKQHDELLKALKRDKRQKRTPKPGPVKQHSYTGVGASSTKNGRLPSIRKTGSKKGVLEYEVDAAALKALDMAKQHVNVHQLEWEIDKYLDVAGKDYDIDADLLGVMANPLTSELLHEDDDVEMAENSDVIKETQMPNVASVKMADVSSAVPPLPSAAAQRKFVSSNTPPPTDYFSSDFDLYDLVTSCHSGLHGPADHPSDNKRSTGFSLYNLGAFTNYFRKRKNLKSNRTGWPKVQKKKTSVRQQQRLKQKIRFLHGFSEESSEIVVKQPPDDDNLEDESRKDETRESGVITPPDTDADDADNDGEEDGDRDEEEEEEDDDEEDEEEEDSSSKRRRSNGVDEVEGEEETELDAGDSIPEEDDLETMADSVEEDERGEADDEDAGDIDEDEEEEEADADDCDGDGDGDGNGNGDDDGDADADADCDADSETENKQTRRLRSTIATSPMEKLPCALTVGNLAVATSTPSTQSLRGSRRTPQLNGSIGSCISPSEKTGDNSDIFTVSSDGLDTDLDISSSQQLDKLEEEHHNVQHESCPHHTPKRKYDISKYAPSNSTSSTCAAEAATAAVKSLAISQFLKKEVRVQCRRLPAPFRRFRYRR